jgi:hypothetical protein
MEIYPKSVRLQHSRKRVNAILRNIFEHKKTLSNGLILLIIAFLVVSAVSATTITTISEVSAQWETVNPLDASTANDEDFINDRGDHIIQGGDLHLTYELPFTFHFMGRNIVNITVNTNGLIELLESGESCRFWCGIWSTHSHGEHINRMDAIFASNDDLQTEDSSDYLGVFNLGDRIIVEWKGTTYDDAVAGENLPIHFQVVLHQDGNVIWNFKTMDWNRMDGDMFTGAYAREEDEEFEAGYEIKSQTSFTYDFSETPPETTSTSSTTTSTTTTTSTSTTSTTTQSPTSTTSSTSTTTSTSSTTTSTLPGTTTTTTSTTTTSLVPQPKVIILSNSIDFALAKDFFAFLRDRGFNVVRATAQDYDPYENEDSIVLGGPDAPEGVGVIVQSILSPDEQEVTREPGASKMFVKGNEKGSRVIILAGSDRTYTSAAHQDFSDTVILELET